MYGAYELGLVALSCCVSMKESTIASLTVTLKLKWDRI